MDLFQPISVSVRATDRATDQLDKQQHINMERQKADTHIVQQCVQHLA